MRWPHLCISCGESDPDQLKYYRYRYQKTDPMNRKGYGSDTMTNFWMDVQTFLCSRCLTKTRWKLIITILIGLMFIIIGAILMDTIDFFRGGYGGLILICVGIFITFFTIFMRRKLPNYYFKVKLMRKPIQIQFKNSEFANEYLSLNGSFDLIL